jgi:hypothetical protein
MMSLEGFLEINVIVIARAVFFRPKQSPAQFWDCFAAKSKSAARNDGAGK